MARDTKEALLAVAQNAARKYGYDGFSYADLAQEIGIRKASIHYHFATKAALGAAIVTQYDAKMTAALDRISATHATAGERLSALIDHYCAALDGGNSLCLCVSLSVSRDHLPEAVLTLIEAFRQKVALWIEAAFELGQEDKSISNIAGSKDEAWATLALLEGAQLAARATQRLEPFSQATHILRHRCTIRSGV